MRICFIANSASVHAQRIISYYVTKQDEILVLSSARRRCDLPGTKTVHLLITNRNDLVVDSFPKVKRQPRFFVRLKRCVPRNLVVLFKRVVRALRLFCKWKFCVTEIRRFNADVIYCFRSFPEGVLASQCHVRPLLLRTAGQDISRLPRYPIYRQLIRRALRTADVVVTESFCEQKLLRQLCGAKVNPEVNIIGVDTSLFHATIQRDEHRRRYGLPRDSFVVVSNRYLDGAYNGWLVVEAIQSILGKCPNLFLLYVSPSQMGFRTRTKAESVAVRFPQIRFIEGPLPHSEMPGVLGCGDIYVTFSSADGIPNSLLEAMACGLVPVAADLPQIREWIEDGRNGYLVPQAQVASLAFTIRELYMNRQVLRHMSMRCIMKIQELASYEKCSERTTLLLERARRDTELSSRQ